MPPKKTTGTKKTGGRKSRSRSRQVEIEKAAELERLKAEQIEQQRLEAERLEKEAHEHRLKAEGDRRRREEAARIKAEEDEVSLLEAQVKDRWTVKENADRAAKEWQDYITCASAPAATDEAAVRTFCSLWRDKTQEDPQKTADECQKALDLITSLEVEVCKKEQEGHYDEAKNTSLLMNEVVELVNAKVDEVTSYLIERSDRFVNSRGEVLRTAIADDIVIGCWVNIAKNPRVSSRGLIFAEQTRLTSSIPKSLALASVAVRMVKLRRDHLTTSTSPMTTLGGVCLYDLLTIPPPPKKANGWTFRMDVTSDLIPVSYPLPQSADSTPAVAGSAHWPALKVAFPVPSDVAVRNLADPKIAWWDIQKKAWLEEGITEVRFNATSRVLSFHTTHLAPLAIVQNGHVDLPLKEWSLTAAGPNKAVLSLVSPITQVEIEITENSLRLLQPTIPELEHLRTHKYQPVDFFRRLHLAGVSIHPGRDLQDSLVGVMHKTSETEEMLSRDISLVCCAYAVAGSKWNQSRGANRALFLIRENTSWLSPAEAEEAGLEEQNANEEKESPEESLTNRSEVDTEHRPSSSRSTAAQSNKSPPSTPTSQEASPQNDGSSSDADWHSIVMQDSSYWRAKTDETDESCSEEMVEGARFHPRLYTLLSSEAQTATAARIIRETSPHFIETVRATLLACRPFSVTS